MIERYAIVKRINTSSGIIGNGYPGSWQPSGVGMVILFDSSVINRLIRYKDIRLKKFLYQTMNIVLMMTTTSEQCN